MPNTSAKPARSPDTPRGPSVVNFREEGTMYDVPIDLLWEFMNWDGHGAAHEKSGRNFAVLEEAPNRFLVTYETFRGGDWRPIRCRVIDFPPLGRVVEELEGLYKGTQIVALYTAVGRKTRLDIIARFVSEVLDPETLERHMVDSIQNAGVEDEPYLRKFAWARSSR